MTLRIGFTVTWPQMVFAVPTHPVTICFLNFSGYCHIGCYKKAEGGWWSSSSKLILLFFFFLRQIYWSHVCHLGKVRIKKKIPDMKKDRLWVCFTSVSAGKWFPALNYWWERESRKPDFYSWILSHVVVFSDEGTNTAFIPAFPSPTSPPPLLSPSPWPRALHTQPPADDPAPADDQLLRSLTSCPRLPVVLSITRIFFVKSTL